MRIEVLAIVMLAPLAAALPAWSQQAQSGDTTAAPSTAGTPADMQPEQAGDLYQVKATRTGGELELPAKPDDPVPGALNPPTESLGADRQADPKD